MFKKLPVSLIIIARNEERNLPRCLDSAAPWVSEIIGVINDCTDKTREILESYGAKVYEHDWDGYTNQKKFALAQTTQPWILSLDADEQISPCLARSIQEFFEKDNEQYNGAYWARKTWFLKKWIKHGDWYPDYVVRLFKKDKGHFSGGRVHEKIILDGTTKKLKGNLLHYSFENIGHMNNKLYGYGDAFLKDKVEKGESKFSASGTILRALWRFLRCYFIRLGFLDGYPGFYISFNQAFYTLFRYTHLYEYIKRDVKPKFDKEDK